MPKNYPEGGRRKQVKVLKIKAAIGIFPNEKDMSILLPHIFFVQKQTVEKT